MVRWKCDSILAWWGWSVVKLWCNRHWWSPRYVRQRSVSYVLGANFCTVAGIIPHIKKHSPNTRIIFRCHIEIRADLIRDNPDGPQADTWKWVEGSYQIWVAMLHFAHAFFFNPDKASCGGSSNMPISTSPILCTTSSPTRCHERMLPCFPHVPIPLMGWTNLSVNGSRTITDRYSIVSAWIRAPTKWTGTGRTLCK